MKSLFFGMFNAPNISDNATSLFRLIDESVRQGHNVIVWCCGSSTGLTNMQLTNCKPKNLLEIGTGRWDYEYPSTLSLVNEMIEKSDGRLKWYVCRHCMQERGAPDQSPCVTVSAPHKFVEYRKSCDVAMFTGIM